MCSIIREVEGDTPINKTLNFDEVEEDNDDEYNFTNLIGAADKIRPEYDGTFYGNTLMIGPTQCGKTYMIKKLIKNGFLKQNVLIWVHPHAMDDNFKSFARDVRKNFPDTTVTLVSLEKESKRKGEYVDNILRGTLKKAVSENHKKGLKTTIVFDDLMVELMREACPILSCFSRWRHFNCKTVILCQSFLDKVSTFKNLLYNSQQVCLFFSPNSGNPVKNYLRSVITQQWKSDANGAPDTKNINILVNKFYNKELGSNVGDSIVVHSKNSLNIDNSENRTKDTDINNEEEEEQESYDSNMELDTDESDTYDNDPPGIEKKQREQRLKNYIVKNYSNPNKQIAFVFHGKNYVNVHTFRDKQKQGMHFSCSTDIDNDRDDDDDDSDSNDFCNKRTTSDMDSDGSSDTIDEKSFEKNNKKLRLDNTIKNKEKYKAKQQQDSQSESEDEQEDVKQLNAKMYKRFASFLKLLNKTTGDTSSEYSSETDSSSSDG